MNDVGRYELKTPYGVVACTAADLFRVLSPQTPTYEMMRVLWFLNSAGPSTPTQIGRGIGKSPTNVTHFLDRAIYNRFVSAIGNGRYSLEHLGRAVVEISGVST